MSRAPASGRQAGFTYLGLIILVTIIGLVGAATLKVGVLLQRAAAEEELLAVGAAFSDALQSYAAATPKGQPAQPPPTLQDLLKDPRFPGTRRHLRKIFVDPVTGKAEWGILYQGDKVGVLAVYSLSEAKPLKIANFDARFANFENREHLSEWKFTTSGMGLVQKVLVTSSAPGAGPRYPELLAAPVPKPAAEMPAAVPVPAEPPQAAPPPPPEPAEPAEPAEEPEEPAEPAEPAAPAPEQQPALLAPAKATDR